MHSNLYSLRFAVMPNHLLGFSLRGSDSYGRLAQIHPEKDGGL